MPVIKADTSLGRKETKMKKISWITKFMWEKKGKKSVVSTNGDKGREGILFIVKRERERERSTRVNGRAAKVRSMQTLQLHAWLITQRITLFPHFTKHTDQKSFFHKQRCTTGRDLATFLNHARDDNYLLLFPYK